MFDPSRRLHLSNRSATREQPLALADVVILRSGPSAASQGDPQKIADFLGIQATCVVLTAAGLDAAGSVPEIVPACTCLIADAGTLVRAAKAMRDGASGLHRLTDRAEHLFVYGFRPTAEHGAVLSALSSGSIGGIQPLRGHAKFQVADDHHEWCGQFAGLSFGTTNAAIDNTFIDGEAPRYNGLILAGDKPFFVRATSGRCQVFLSACAELADLDEAVDRQLPLLTWFSRLAPLMMFLRGALGDRVWHNDNPRACFIIDDPWLKNDRYGFLEYERLVASMRQRKYSTSIAFIPWNYRRSSRDVTKLFSSKNQVPRLCVHGCDHTSGEFAATDIGALRRKARMALKRMQIHHRLSGVPFDDVMVFPQGLFSAEAIAALKTSGYLAAVNSDLFPSTEPESLHLRDLLDVAVTNFDDFPLFGRRYPSDLADFAFDLFLGKPALAVEHHGYFRDGYAALESFVERLNGLDERLEWADLGTICSCACLTRVAPDGEVQIRFYTSRFSLTNRGTATRRYSLVRQQTAGGPAPCVTINGREWSAQREDGRVRVNLSLDPGQTADIGITSDDIHLTDPEWRESPLHNAKVLIRRHLSEFRDNHVDTSRVLSTIVATARN